MAHGRIVADGPTTEIKARVGTKTIRATLPDVDVAELAALPGVASADRRGESVALRCSDSDSAIRALLASHPQAHDIEIAGAGGGRIALPVRAYFRAKILTSYMMALTSLVLLYIAGAALGVTLSAHDWLAMSGLIVVALLPFGAFAILLGHLMTVESIGPITGGTVSLLAIFSGTWFPATGFLHTVGQWQPAYWLVQAGRVTLEGHGWGARGWAVVIAWTALLAVLAGVAYRRDTGRV
jgi:hypothetical protein